MGCQVQLLWFLSICVIVFRDVGRAEYTVGLFFVLSTLVKYGLATT